MAEDKSLFLKIFGGSPIIKTLDFLITFREFDYSLTDIAEQAGVGWTTLHQFWPQLEKMQIVRPTRTIGRAKLYKLNIQNPVVKTIIQLDQQMCSYYSDAQISGQKERRAVKATA
ncbi:MAG: hypothetical protein V1911_01255 [Candidatus Micrarchaeota archaeon]